MMKNTLMILAVGTLLGGAAVRADEIIFNGEKGTLNGGVVQADPEKADNKAGFWKGAAKGNPVNIKLSKQDFSRYKALTFRMYSAKADGHGLIIVCDSDRAETKGGDYFYKKIKIDWKGWKTFVIPLEQFGKSRKPAGWSNITRIGFNNRGWGLKPNKEAKYYIDDLKFLSAIPEGYKDVVKKK